MFAGFQLWEQNTQDNQLEVPKFCSGSWYKTIVSLCSVLGWGEAGLCGEEYGAKPSTSLATKMLKERWSCHEMLSR